MIHSRWEGIGKNTLTKLLPWFCIPVYAASYIPILEEDKDTKETKEPEAQEQVVDGE